MIILIIIMEEKQTVFCSAPLLSSLPPRRFRLFHGTILSLLLLIGSVQGHASAAEKRLSDRAASAHYHFEPPHFENVFESRHPGLRRAPLHAGGLEPLKNEALWPVVITPLPLHAPRVALPHRAPSHEVFDGAKEGRTGGGDVERGVRGGKRQAAEGDPEEPQDTNLQPLPPPPEPARATESPVRSVAEALVEVARGGDREALRKELKAEDAPSPSPSSPAPLQADPEEGVGSGSQRLRLRGPMGPMHLLIDPDQGSISVGVDRGQESGGGGGEALGPVQLTMHVLGDEAGQMRASFPRPHSLLPQTQSEHKQARPETKRSLDSVRAAPPPPPAPQESTMPKGYPSAVTDSTNEANLVQLKQAPALVQTAQMGGTRSTSEGFEQNPLRLRAHRLLAQVFPQRFTYNADEAEEKSGCGEGTTARDLDCNENSRVTREKQRVFYHRQDISNVAKRHAEYPGEEEGESAEEEATEAGNKVQRLQQRSAEAPLAETLETLMESEVRRNRAEDMNVAADQQQLPRQFQQLQVLSARGAEAAADAGLELGREGGMQSQIELQPPPSPPPPSSRQPHPLQQLFSVVTLEPIQPPQMEEASDAENLQLQQHLEENAAVAPPDPLAPSGYGTFAVPDPLPPPPSPLPPPRSLQPPPQSQPLYPTPAQQISHPSPPAASGAAPPGPLMPSPTSPPLSSSHPLPPRPPSQQEQTAIPVPPLPPASVNSVPGSPNQQAQTARHYQGATHSALVKLPLPAPKANARPKPKHKTKLLPKHGTDASSAVRLHQAFKAGVAHVALHPAKKPSAAAGAIVDHERGSAPTHTPARPPAKAKTKAPAARSWGDAGGGGSVAARKTQPRLHAEGAKAGAHPSEAAAEKEFSTNNPRWSTRSQSHRSWRANFGGAGGRVEAAEALVAEMGEGAELPVDVASEQLTEFSQQSTVGQQMPISQETTAPQKTTARLSRVDAAEEARWRRLNQLLRNEIWTGDLDGVPAPTH